MTFARIASRTLPFVLLATAGGCSGTSNGSGTQGAGATGGSAGASGAGAAAAVGGNAANGGSSGGSGGSGASSGGSAGSEAGGAGGSGNVGGTASGGASGASGAGGSSGARGTQGVCKSAADCALSIDCCLCFAAGPGEGLATCTIACNQTACEAAGVTADDMACVAGRCVLDRDCDLTSVSCDIEEPECPVGQVPSAINGCYGPCTTVSECRRLSSCEPCAAAGLECVQMNGGNEGRYHCVSTPPECEGHPSCSCMQVCGPLLCGPADDLSCWVTF